MLVRASAMVVTVEELVHDAPLVFIVGIFTTIAGVAMVIAHNVWSGGVTPVVVTVIGWLTLIKGALLAFLSPDQVSGFYLGALSYEQHFYVYSIFSIVVGAYLTYAGFAAKAD